MKVFLKWALITFYILPIIMFIFAAFAPLDGTGQPIASTKIQLLSLSDRLKEFKKSCGRFPLTSEGLEILLSQNINKLNLCKGVPREGFLESTHVPINPWENEFRYKSDGTSFTLTTNGDGWSFIKKNDQAVEMNRIGSKFQSPFINILIYILVPILGLAYLIFKIRRSNKKFYIWTFWNVLASVGWLIYILEQSLMYETNVAPLNIYILICYPLIVTFYYRKYRNEQSDSVGRLFLNSGVLVCFVILSVIILTFPLMISAIV